jgi:cytosine/adenosine deaminase-related metal-dependent hydrolase
MKYRKISADKILDGYRFRQNEVVIVREDGCIEEIIPFTEAGEGVEKHEGILTPGFINCHCHLELSHMRGKIPEQTGLVDFVFKVVTERSASSEEEILAAIAGAEEEMKKAGIVAVGDICNNTITLPTKEKGNLPYYNFIEASGWLPAVSEARFERAKGIYEEYVNRQSAISNQQSETTPIRNSKSQIRNSIVPHAPYSVSENLWKKIQPYFQNKVVSIHNQETRFEDKFFLQGTGDFVRMYQLMKIDNSHHQPTKRSSLQSYFHKLSGAQKIILVHNAFTKQEDIDFVNQQSAIGNRQSAIGNQKQPQSETRNPKPETFFCLCPNANLYIENILPPVELFRKNNCTIVLGTDSLASNWSLNILDEIKTIQKHFPQIPLEEMLRWATTNAAKALDMDKELGSFEKGKKPGGVLIAENKLDIKRVLF